MFTNESELFSMPAQTSMRACKKSVFIPTTELVKNSQDYNGELLSQLMEKSNLEHDTNKKIEIISDCFGVWIDFLTKTQFSSEQIKNLFLTFRKKIQIYNIYLYQGKIKRNRQFEKNSQMAENYLLGMDSALKYKI